MDAFVIQHQYQEPDPCYITKLACNTTQTEVIGALFSTDQSYIRLWSKDFQLTNTIKDTCDITDICFNKHDGNNLICGTREGNVKIWDIRTSAPVQEFNVGSSDEILSVAPGYQDRSIACAVRNNVIVTDVRMNKIINQLEDHTDTVTVVDFHPIRDSLLCSLGEDNLCVLRYMDNVSDIHPFTINDAARHLTFSGPDRSLMCVLSTSEQVTTFSLGQDDFGTTRQASTSIRDSPLLSQGDSSGYVVSTFYEDWKDNILTLGGSTDGQLLLFDGETIRASFAPFHTDVVRSALCLDSKIWTCGEDGKIAIWESEERPIELQTTVYRQPSKPKRAAPY